jgi:DnaJ-class molecular chaperone
MDCKACFSRGFVATCKACEGNGQITIPVAGTNSGDMKSTCDKCGGTGTFPANKPEGWDEQQAAIAKAAEEAELQAV